MFKAIKKIKKLTPITIIGIALTLTSNLGWIGSIIIPFIPFLSIEEKELLIPVFVIAGQVLFYTGLACLGKGLAKRLGKKTFIPRQLLRKIKLFFHRKDIRSN